MNKIRYLIIATIVGGALFIVLITSLSTPSKQIQKSVGQVAVPTVYENKKTLEDNKQTFDVSSSLITRSNNLITDGANKTVFKRTVFLAPKTVLPTITSYTKTYGASEKDFIGSKYYGHDIVTRVYSTKGVTIIGNTQTDEVYELQEYVPMSVTSYVETYGKDIDMNASNRESL